MNIPTDLEIPMTDTPVSCESLQVGKRMAFGEIDLCGAQGGKSVFRASTTYALI